MSKSAMKLGELLIMAEPLLLGMVIGFVPITIAGLLMAAYIQYRRGNQLGM
jgi:cytochrome b6-f complex subunit 5